MPHDIVIAAADRSRKAGAVAAIDANVIPRWRNIRRVNVYSVLPVVSCMSLPHQQSWYSGIAAISESSPIMTLLSIVSPHDATNFVRVSTRSGRGSAPSRKRSR